MGAEGVSPAVGFKVLAAMVVPTVAAAVAFAAAVYRDIAIHGSDVFVVVAVSV